VANQGVRRLVLLGAGLALVAAACGGGGDSGDAYKEPTGPAVETIDMESGNFYFEPNEIETPPGIIAINLKNNGGLHDLVIRDVPGFQIEVSGDGDENSGKVELKKRKYEFYCSVPGHEEAGMKGTLTVR
jgi:nitrite reductase (NO-forming)